MTNSPKISVPSIEVVDVRYVLKSLFLILTSINLGNTFDCLWLGILFALFFGYVAAMNATRRREFANRPRYSKLLAYGAIVPLAMYWVVTPGVESGVNPALIFAFGLYMLFLAALQERSRGHGGFETFVAFDGVSALLVSMFMVPHGWALVGIVALVFALLAYSRRGTSWYKYLLFVLLMVCLGGISYGGWRYWRMHRYEYGAQMAEDYYQRERVMGFDAVAALGNFRSNYSGKYNDQVVLRVWDSIPPKYLKAASYEKYVAGIWKLPTVQLKSLTPAYYQVDYAVMEVADSLTRAPAREVWVQSTIDNFGFVFAPYGTVGFAAKDIDSLHYFAGGMVNGLNGNGKRSDWYYFVPEDSLHLVPDSLMMPAPFDTMVSERYYPLLDSAIVAMALLPDSAEEESGRILPDSVILKKMLGYFRENFTYTLSIPGLSHWSSGGSNINRDPLAIFWREKQGFCEYYATLATLVLRHMGIPARYATGFVNPERVEGRSYGIYRRRSSHAWVEVYADSRWVVFDPTPPMMLPMGISDGWWNTHYEGFKGRMARLMHALKEGGWRRTVDSWQSLTQNFLDSAIPYVILALLIATLVAHRIYRMLKNRPKSIAVKSGNAVAWIRKLGVAERNLARLGFHRETGETVAQFVMRICIEADARKESMSDREKDTLEKSLDVLNEYETNRWRK